MFRLQAWRAGFVGRGIGGLEFAGWAEGLTTTLPAFGVALTTVVYEESLLEGDAPISYMTPHPGMWGGKQEKG